MRQHLSPVRPAALAGTLAAAVALTACSATPEADADTLSAVATTTQICDYITQLAAAEPSVHLTKTDATGERTETGDASAETSLELTCLLAPNASAHEHEMTPQQMQALGSADLFVTNGVDLEHFLDNSVEAAGFKGTMVVSSGVANTGQKDGDFTVDTGVRAVDVKPWPFAPEPGEEAEFTNDPHVWTAPDNAHIQVDNISHALAQADPDHAQAWEQAGKAYGEKLEKLDTWARASLNTVPSDRRVLFTSHDAFGYFSNAYGVEFIGAALSDFNSQHDATSQHIEEAAKQVRDSGAVALFAENSNNPKSIEAVARAAGVRAITDDDALYGDSLGPAGSAGETYIGSIVHNVTTLVNAWGGTAEDFHA